MGTQPKKSTAKLSPEFQKLLEAVEPQLILEQIGKDPVYFMRLVKMNREELQAEINCLDMATYHYRNATGDDLDYHWPASAKRQASKDGEKLRLARHLLVKYSEIFHLMQAAEASKS